MTWDKVIGWIITALGLTCTSITFLYKWVKSSKARAKLEKTQDILGGVRDILSEIVNSVSGLISPMQGANGIVTPKTPKDEETPREEEKTLTVEVPPSKDESVHKEEAKTEPLNADKWLSEIYSQAIKAISDGDTCPVFGFLRDYVSQVYYKQFNTPIKGGEEVGREEPTDGRTSV